MQPDEVCRRPHLAGCKYRGDGVARRLPFLGVFAGHQEVVHINQDKYHDPRLRALEEALVGCTGSEACRQKHVNTFLVPGPRRLLKSIQGLEEAEHLGLVTPLVALRLADVYFLLQLSVEEGRFDFQL